MGKALPGPDVGVLTARTPTVDIVVPVFNALAETRWCVESLLSDASASAATLWLVDDASDSHTAAYLQACAAREPRVRYVRNASNEGFLRSANRGMQAGSAEFVILVNSDVLVPDGWLARMLVAATSDDRIAAVNPLTNRASQIDLQMPPGTNVFGVDATLGQRTPRLHDIVTGVGFCLLLRREALRAVGLFDEVFERGYCEESDLCMRLVAAGWRTVITEQVYVFHRGSASFADRDARYLRNRRIFDQRWAAEYQRQFRAFRRADPLQPLRRELYPRNAANPMPAVWGFGRALRHWLRRPTLGGVRLLAGRALAIPAARRVVADAGVVQRYSRPARLRVTYVLPSMVVAGGVLSVIQLVNRLVLRGFEARIATPFVDPALRSWAPLLSEPMVLSTSTQRIRRLPETDILVATHWSTVEDVLALCAAGRARHPVYFAQDYEPWFVPESQPQVREAIAQGYARFPHLIAKSRWLTDLLQPHAVDGRIHRIPLGLDLDVFYPRDVARHPRRIIAMARPKTPRRGFATLVAALQRIVAAQPDVEIELFGDDDIALPDSGLRYRNLGVLSSQRRLAEAYSGAAVFIDSSDFQGFGRCALEAMACDCAVVVTDVGGVAEYARDGETALTCKPRDAAALADAVLRLLHDDGLRMRLQANGRAEAARFSLDAEADATAALFRSMADAA